MRRCERGTCALAIGASMNVNTASLMLKADFPARLAMTNDTPMKKNHRKVPKLKGNTNASKKKYGLHATNHVSGSPSINLDDATGAALRYEARALTAATERLLKLLDEFSLLPFGVLESGFQWNLVSRP